MFILNQFLLLTLVFVFLNFGTTFGKEQCEVCITNVNSIKKVVEEEKMTWREAIQSHCGKVTHPSDKKICLFMSRPIHAWDSLSTKMKLGSSTESLCKSELCTFKYNCEITNSLGEEHGSEAYYTSSHFVNGACSNGGLFDVLDKDDDNDVDKEEFSTIGRIFKISDE